MSTKTENINLLKDDLDETTFEAYSSCDLLAVDCEMMGLNPYRDRLCLIQMCNENNLVAMVKFNATELNNIQKSSTLKAPRLKKLFENIKVKKIFHYGRTDLSFLYFWLGIEIKNVFCTKSASRLVRTFTDKHSLKDLAKEFENINLDKNSQTSDWGADELTKEQMKYAANDVLHLIPIYKKLILFLKREGRLELAEEANSFLPTLAKLDLLGYADFFAH